MACDDYVTTGVRVADSSGNLGVMNLGSLLSLADEIAAAYPGLTCSELTDAVNNYVNFPTPDLALFKYTDTIDLSPLLSTANWSLSSLPPGAGTKNINVNNIDINNVLTPIGNFAVSYDASGNVTGVVNNLTVPLIYQLNLTTNCGVSIQGFTSPFQTFSQLPLTNAILGIDAGAFVGCVIPACAIAPTALPTSPGTIKSANFTRIFNPLNLPLRSK